MGIVPLLCVSERDTIGTCEWLQEKTMGKEEEQLQAVAQEPPLHILSPYY